MKGTNASKIQLRRNIKKLNNSLYTSIRILELIIKNLSTREAAYQDEFTAEPYPTRNDKSNNIITQSFLKNLGGVTTSQRPL